MTKVELADLLKSFPDTPDGRQRRAEFMECGHGKAGMWVLARPLDYLSRLTNGEWWLSSAIRLGINPYPEVHPSAVCKACKQPIGVVITHSQHCPKAGRRGRNLRHTGVKNALATLERRAEAGTNTIMEPFIQPYLGGPVEMPSSTEKDYSSSRADVAVRTPSGANYVVDVTIVDATCGPAPASDNYIAGKGTEKAFDDKVVQHVQRFPKIDVQTQLRIAAFDLRGGMSECTIGYAQEIITREHEANPLIPKSVVASRLYQRLSVSVVRSVAYNAMEYRIWRVPVAVPRAPPAPLPVAHGGGVGVQPVETEA